jgi:tetratricopeptide (TPR) repeat protein
MQCEAAKLESVQHIPMNSYSTGDEGSEIKQNRDESSTSSSLHSFDLNHHASVLNNIGAHLMERGEMLNAMRVLQQSVQTMMLTEDDATPKEGAPNAEQSQNWLNRLSEERRGDSSPPTKQPASSPLSEEDKLNNCRQFGIPGLFGSLSKIRNSSASSERPILTFPDSFHVAVDESDVQPLRKDSSKKSIFMSPFHQCSKATLFNMGLIHYTWGSDDSAVQFFELAISLASSTPPINPDLIILACLNNIGQIRLQCGRTPEATALFSDALTRGEASFALIYKDDRSRSSSHFSSTSSITANEVGHTDTQPTSALSSVPSSTSTRSPTPLHRFLARTLMNIGQVYFCNCDFTSSKRTWLDALRLLHPRTPDVKAAALEYNMGLLHHHQNERVQAIEQLDLFLEKATRLLGGRNHLQVAAALHRKGWIYFEMGDLYKSMKPLTESLHIRTQLLGPKHALVAQSLFKMAKVLQEREEYEWASRALEDCLEVRRSRCPNGEGSLEVTQTLMELGRTYHARGQREASVEAYLEVIRLTQRFFGHRHKYVARIQNIVGNLYLEVDQVGKAMIYLVNAMRIHVEEGLPIDLAVVHNSLLRVHLERHPGAGMA